MPKTDRSAIASPARVSASDDFRSAKCACFKNNNNKHQKLHDIVKNAPKRHYSIVANPMALVLAAFLPIIITSQVHLMPSSQSILSSLPRLLMAEAAPSRTNGNSSDEEKEQRRRERHNQSYFENANERRQWQRHQYEYDRSGYHYSYQDMEDGNDYEDEYNEGTMSGMPLSLFVTQKPRDVVDGIRSAFSNIFRGIFYGIATFFASPITGMSQSGTVGFVQGGLIGTVLGVAMPIAGFLAGGYQMIRGLIATPAAILDGFFRCKVWNDTNFTWGEYRLDEEVNEIKMALEEEKEEGKKKQRSTSSRYGSTSSSRRVKNTKYYDMLGLKSDATGSEIRSAYRKRARTIHPDKNPDDPDAERKFRELSAVYQTLSDPVKREKYDSSGVGIDAEQPEDGEGGPSMLDPYVFFAVLFGSEQVEPYIGELGMASTFDSLLKLANLESGANKIESWEELKTLFDWNETSLKRRKRQTDIALHLRSRIEDYVYGYLELDAFRDSCWEEAVNIAKGESYGATFLLAIGPALVAEADAFLGYRASILGSWRGPVSNMKKRILFLRRRWALTTAILRTVRESLKAIYESAEILSDDEDDMESYHRDHGKLDKVLFKDKDLLKDNLSKTIPTLINMAWSINIIDISNTLSEACNKLFYDADVSSFEERLRRAEAIQILGSQFYLVGMEKLDGNMTHMGNVDDIKARAMAAFMESLNKGMENNM